MRIDGAAADARRAAFRRVVTPAPAPVERSGALAPPAALWRIDATSTLARPLALAVGWLLS